MSTLRTLILSLSVLAVAAPAALAQPKTAPKSDKADKKGAGKTVELGDDDSSGSASGSSDDSSGSLGDGTGAEENPGAPRMIGEDQETKPGKAKPTGPVEYPMELSQRPINLYAGMSEVSLDLAAHPAASASSGYGTVYGALHASYGITSDVQLSLGYGAGALVKSKFKTGKTIGVDARYRIFPWLSAQFAVPFLLDPVSFGIGLGAPMKFRFDKFALFFGEDLLRFKIKNFTPDVDNAAATAGFVDANTTGTEIPPAELRLVGGVIYQIHPNLAFTGRIGILQQLSAPTSYHSTRVPIYARLTYSKTTKMDLGARIFIEDMSRVGNSFGLGVFAALRI